MSKAYDRSRNILIDDFFFDSIVEFINKFHNRHKLKVTLSARYNGLTLGKTVLKGVVNIIFMVDERPHTLDANIFHNKWEKVDIEMSVTYFSWWCSILFKTIITSSGKVSWYEPIICHHVWKLFLKID